jgi:23S rRNA (uracil1939-C5)-methyltransferase
MKKRQKHNKKISPPKEAHIVGMAPHGWAVSGKGRDRVHVWGGLLGDVLQLGHFKQERGRVEAAIEKVNHRLIETIPASCEHFDICGGCLWQHVPYEAQLVMKQEIVKSCFANERLDTGCVLPVMGCDAPFEYRNKNDFTFGFGKTPALGFFESEMKISAGRKRQERGQVPPVFAVQSCALQSVWADRILSKVRALLAESGLSYYHPGSRRGILRSLVIRQSAALGDVLVHFVATKDCAQELTPVANALIQDEEVVKGVVLSVNNKRSKNAVPQEQTILAGQDWIVEQVLGLTLRVSPTTFMQVNTKQAEKLYEIALDFAELTEQDQVIDLYCGTGSLSLLLAQRSGSVLGIEVIDAAVQDAKRNAAVNKIENCDFVCGDVAEVLPSCVKNGKRPQVVTVNPPRAGVVPEVIQEICSVRPQKIVYISCNAETLARDLVHFNRGGYRIRVVQPVDMFPQTPHVEVVVKLEQRPQS